MTLNEQYSDFERMFFGRVFKAVFTCPEEHFLKKKTFENKKIYNFFDF